MLKKMFWILLLMSPIAQANDLHTELTQIIAERIQKCDEVTIDYKWGSKQHSQPRDYATIELTCDKNSILFIDQYDPRRFQSKIDLIQYRGLGGIQVVEWLEIFRSSIEQTSLVIESVFSIYDNNSVKRIFDNDIVDLIPVTFHDSRIFEPYSRAMK